jgi:Fe-S-cluster containining protein
MNPADFLEALNANQPAAAAYPAGPLLVIAGAGTGKTKTLAARVARLIRAGASPGRILRSVSPLPSELEEELRAAVERFKRSSWPPDGSPCIWYDPERRRCRHYEYRPVLCRDEVKPGDRFRELRRA